MLSCGWFHNPSVKVDAFFFQHCARDVGRGPTHVTIRLHDRTAAFELAPRPDMKLGELYMDGRMTVEEGDVALLLDLVMTNLCRYRANALVLQLATRRRKMPRRFAQYNPTSRSKAHVAHHYDLSSRLYDLFLDKDRQYSCAYFNVPDDTLEEAQIAKKRHIAAKLHLSCENFDVLDIGCGWGGLAL